MNARKLIDEQRLRTLWANGTTLAEIGREFGCSGSHVSACAKRLGLPRRTIVSGSLPTREIVRVYVDHGMPINQIVRRLRPRFPTLADYTVRKLLLANGVKLHPRHRQLTSVAECVQLARQNLSCRQIGKRLGLTPTQARRRVCSVLGLLGRGRKPTLPVGVIVSRALSGETHVSIASDLGCSESAVSFHVRRQRRLRAARRLASAPTHAGDLAGATPGES